MHTPNPARAERALLASQGAFYLATGIWPLLDRSSFERITGPKVDFWLVRTVGAVLAVTGAAMLVGATRRHTSPESRVMAVGAAGALAAVDIVYAGRGRISRVYLADAAVEVGLLAGWLAASLRRLRRPRPRVEIVSGELVGDEALETS